MKQTILQVFDPPMCCSSGVCGPNVNPELVRFSTDLDWLKQQGITVERCNLSSHPAAFAQNEVVREALKSEGNGCLPLVIVNGAIISRGLYPTRDQLAGWAGLDRESPTEYSKTRVAGQSDVVIDDRIRELIAIGASMSSHCQPCLAYHLEKARTAGTDEAAIDAAIAIGLMVEKGASKAMRDYIDVLLNPKSSTDEACCSGGSSDCCG